MVKHDLLWYVKRDTDSLVSAVTVGIWLLLFDHIQRSRTDSYKHDFSFVTVSYCCSLGSVEEMVHNISIAKCLLWAYNWESRYPLNVCQWAIWRQVDIACICVFLIIPFTFPSAPPTAYFWQPMISYIKLASSLIHVTAKYIAISVPNRIH